MDVSIVFKWLFSFFRKKKDVSVEIEYPHLFPQMSMVEHVHTKFSSKSNTVPYRPTHLAHRLYRSSLRNLGIYNAQQPVGIKDPAVEKSAEHMLSALDLSWAYQLKNPGHWYMSKQRYHSSNTTLSKTDNPFCIRMGFCDLLLDDDNVADIRFALADASTPCWTSAWIPVWIEHYATISANDAFCRAIAILSDPLELSRCKETLPNILLVAWLDQALSLNSELNPSLLDNAVHRYCAVRQQFHPYQRALIWSTAFMNIDAYYDRLLQHVHCLLNEYHSDSSAVALDL